MSEFLSLEGRLESVLQSRPGKGFPFSRQSLPERIFQPVVEEYSAGQRQAVLTNFVVNAARCYAEGPGRFCLISARCVQGGLQEYLFTTVQRLLQVPSVFLQHIEHSRLELVLRSARGSPGF